LCTTSLGDFFFFFPDSLQHLMAMSFQQQQTTADSDLIIPYWDMANERKNFAV